MIFGPNFSIKLLLYSNISIVVHEEWQTIGLKTVTVLNEKIMGEVGEGGRQLIMAQLGSCVE